MVSIDIQTTSHSRGTDAPAHDIGSDIKALPRHSWTWSVAIEHHQHELQAVLVDYKSKQVLLRREKERWVLPALWVYYTDYEKIEEPSAAVREVVELTGVTNETTFLCSLWRKELDVRIDDAICTLEKYIMLFETVADPMTSRHGYEWVKLQNADVYHLFDDAAEAVRDAMQWVSRGSHEPNSFAWQKPGWMRSSVSWMKDALERRCNAQLTKPVYMQRSSGNGVILRAETQKGRFFLKCNSPLANDAAFMDALGGIVPKFVARPVAVDREKQMMVTADYGEIVDVMGLSEEEDKMLARDYVRLQKGTINRIDELIESGFPDLRPVKLLKYIDELPSDKMFRAIGGIEEYAPCVKFFCENIEGSKKLLEELIQSGIPATVTHNDLHFTNVYKPSGTDHYMFFDWVEGFVGHPFTSSPHGVEKEAFLEERKKDCGESIDKLRKLLDVGFCVNKLAALVLKLREASASNTYHAKECIDSASSLLESFQLGLCEFMA